MVNFKWFDYKIAAAGYVFRQGCKGRIMKAQTIIDSYSSRAANFSRRVFSRLFTEYRVIIELGAYSWTFAVGPVVSINKEMGLPYSLSVHFLLFNSTWSDPLLKFRQPEHFLDDCSLLCD
jgi:hypothetical protein